MIEVPSEGIYEIGMKGREIRLIYTTEEKAMDALMEMHRETGRQLEKLFPDGMF